MDGYGELLTEYSYQYKKILNNYYSSTYIYN